jgi:hypothetical protein
MFSAEDGLVCLTTGVPLANLGSRVLAGPQKGNDQMAPQYLLCKSALAIPGLELANGASESKVDSCGGGKPIARLPAHRIPVSI